MKLENISVLIFLLLIESTSTVAQNEESPLSSDPKTILVPEGNSDLVSIDGFFSDEEWIAAGSPLEKYDDVYNKRDGIEFKIIRSKIAANILKLTIGWVRVEVTGQDIDKRTYNFPDNTSLQNADNWVELILPDYL